MALFSKDAPPPPQQARPGGSGAAIPAATMFGHNTTFEGTLTGTEPVVIEGTVRGTIDLKSDLHVGTRGRVEAKVHAKNVVIEGQLTGDVSADERVELVASATVDGNIKAPKIIVADGARFRGSVDMGSARPKENAVQTAK
jgi:cytoskeletal protein CcmA (bactofilin family)